MSEFDDFLKNFGKSTQETYGCALKKYFKVIEKDPKNYFQKGKRKYSEKELLKYEEDVKKFWRAMKNTTPTSLKNYMGVVRVYLQDNYVDLPNKLWKDFKKRQKGTRSIIQDIVPTKKQFKQLITHGNALHKAFITTLLSSGMRIGECCQIKEKDVDFSFKPTKIEIKGEYTKTGNRRTVFISDEATEFLKEWLKEKPQYLEYAVKKLNFKNYEKKLDDERIFPFDKNVGRQKWNKLLIKSGLGQRDNSTQVSRFKIHPHVTRKFYRTWMAKDIGRDMTEYFLGHEAGLDSVYRRYGDDSNKRILGNEYLKGMRNVTIFTDVSEDVEQLNEEISKIRSDNERFKELMDRMQMKIDILETKLEVEKQKNGKK